MNRTFTRSLYQAATALPFEVLRQNESRFVRNARVLEADLETAIEERQLVLHYQPKVSLCNRKLIGFEALVRWNHPERGLLRPAEFIPLAESTGLAVPLNRWVLKQACRQMASWQTAFPMEVPLTIGVNTSFKYLSSPCLIPDIQRLLVETGLKPGSLRLEMAESSITAYGQTAKTTFAKLKAMLIGLEIDDFGTGPDSIGYLRTLSFDTLRIDRSFVRNIGMRNDSSNVIGSILMFVKFLGMNAAAQGVETEEQLKKLTALGCLRGQGYYFSRPVDTASATALAEDEIATAFLNGHTEHVAM